VILANAADALNTYKNNDAAGFPGGAWKVAGEHGVTPATATSLSHMRDNLHTAGLPTAEIGDGTYITAQPYASPSMYGSVDLNDGISNGTLITGEDGPIVLARATAKVTVEVTGAASDFTIVGASLANAPARGHIMPQPSLSAADNTYHYIDAGSPDDAAGYTPLADAAADNLTDALYCYEDSKANGMFVLLKAVYKNREGWYRLDIVDGSMGDAPASRKQLDIERNKWYKLKIGGIGGYGYPTALEAAANRAANLEYTIMTVVSPNPETDAHDIVSNGDYYMGFSNSEFITYIDDAAASGTLTAVRLTHDATDNVSTAKITVYGDGLSIAGTDNAQDVGFVIVDPMTRTQAKFDPGAAVKAFDINIAMSDDFKYGTEGTIVIELGSLRKEIAIRRRAPLPATAGILTTFATGEYGEGVMSGDTPPDWLRFSARDDGTGGMTEINVTHNDGRIYILYDANTSPQSTRHAWSDIFLSRNDDKGRVRIHFTQL
jgi:hypothetical protein